MSLRSDTCYNLGMIMLIITFLFSAGAAGYGSYRFFVTPPITGSGGLALAYILAIVGLTLLVLSVITGIKLFRSMKEEKTKRLSGRNDEAIRHLRQEEERKKMVMTPEQQRTFENYMADQQSLFSPVPDIKF